MSQPPDFSGPSPPPHLRGAAGRDRSFVPETPDEPREASARRPLPSRVVMASAPPAEDDDEADAAEAQPSDRENEPGPDVNEGGVLPSVGGGEPAHGVAEQEVEIAVGDDENVISGPSLSSVLLEWWIQ